MTIHQENIDTFTNYFLLGMPDDEDNIYSQSVVYVCDHSDDGALGLILNKEIDLKMNDLFKKLDLEVSDKSVSSINKKNILLGGSSEPERGFILHTVSEKQYSSTINRTLSITTSLDILEDIAQGEGPDQFLMALGCANWASGQLEQEMRENAWIALPASMEIIFDTAPKEKYNKCLEILGIKPWQLSLFSGNS